MPPPDCPFCERENPAGAKFCNACGSPLHLTPCGDCGAVNNLADPQCWRCGGLLLALDPPPPVERVERELAVPEQLQLLPTQPLSTEQEIEQELVALEQEVQALERAPKSAEASPPMFEHAPRGSGIPGPRAADPRPRRAEQAFRDSNLPEPKSLFVPADDAPRGRRALIVTAVVAALGSAIAVGAYLLDRDRGSSESAAFAPPPSQTRAEPATAPRVAAAVAEAPAAAPEPGCPPAVEAMALCEWLARANPQ